MKKLFLFLNLFLLLSVTGESFASKKYRYIKREHGVRLEGRDFVNMSFPGFMLNFDLSGAYAYNWKGMVEVGPYFELGAGTSNGPFQINSWAAGLLVEYNFIKNRGKRKLIPSLGLTLGANKMDFLNFMAGLHFSLKSFVAKRTAFITTLGYSFHTPINFQFQSMEHHVDIGMGFSYYFDFY